jgi:hypothetical protein
MKDHLRLGHIPDWKVLNMKEGRDSKDLLASLSISTPLKLAEFANALMSTRKTKNS